MPSYFSSWGPLSGPIRAHEVPPAIGVVLAPSAPSMPDGIAYPAGYLTAEGRSGTSPRELHGCIDRGAKAICAHP